MYTDTHVEDIADEQHSAVSYPYLTSSKKTDPSKRSNRGSYPHLINTYEYQPSASCRSQEQAGISSKLLTSGCIGADKIRISVVLDPDSLVIHDFFYRLTGVWGKWNGNTAIKGFPKVFLAWDEKRNILYMEFNPARFFWDQGLTLCPLIYLVDLCGFVMQTILNFGGPNARPLFATEKVNKKTGEITIVYPSDWADQIWVHELHLAVDFYNLGAPFSLSQLEGVQPSRTKAATSHRNNGVLNTLTHVASKGTTKVQLYNKSNERISKPEPDAPLLPPNTYRFEVQLPRRSIRNSALSRLGGCTETNTVDRLVTKWEDSGFHKDLVWEGSMVQVIHGSSLPNAEKNELIGYLTACQYGVTMDAYDPKVIARLNRLAKTFRISDSVPLTKQGPAYGRLDIETACLVAPLKTTYRRPRAKKEGV